MSIVKIENVRVLDPIQKTDSVQTVYLQDGKLIAPVDQVEQTIDGQGKWLMPTMVDLCARLREPGQQQHGTLKSEGKAARANGILHVITPPDSKPIVQDNGALIHGLIEKAWHDGGIHMHIIGAQTQGLMVSNQQIWRALKRVAVLLFQMRMLLLKMTMSLFVH